MAFSPGDIEFYFSAPEAARGFAEPSEAASSLGGYISTSKVPEGPMNNIFSDLSGDDNAERLVEHRCIFVRNANPLIRLNDARLWLVSLRAVSAIEVGVDPTPARIEASVAKQAVTDPAEVRFSLPERIEGSLFIGTLEPNHVRAFWIRRQATDSRAATDNFTVRVQGDVVG